MSIHHPSLNQEGSVLQDWDPASDTCLFHTYSVTDLSEKKKNKEAFQKLVGLRTNPKTPLVCVVPSFSNGKGMNLVEQAAHGIAESGAQLVIFDSPFMPHGSRFKEHTSKQAGFISVIPENERMLHRALAASDILLLPASGHPEGIPQKIAFRYGTVPVLPATDTCDNLMQDYDPRTESGNSFLFMPDSAWSMFAGLVRAFETYKLPYDWRGIQKNGMELTGSEIPLDDGDPIE